MKLLSMVSKGNRIVTVRTYGAAGYMIELTELRVEGGEILKRSCTRLYNKFGTSIREAENWVENNDDSIVTGRLPKLG